MKPENAFEHVPPEDVRRRWDGRDSIVLVDVRTPGEYAQYHIPGVRLIPLDELAGRVEEIDPEAEIICLCEHGVRSEVAARYLASLGYARVATMTGGMAAYPGPVERGTN